MSPVRGIGPPYRTHHRLFPEHCTEGKEGVRPVIHRCNRRVQAELPISIHQDNLWEALTGWPETAIFAGGRTYTRPIEVLVALVALFETGEIAPQMIVGGV